jgi:hypothetical protein
MEGTKTHTQGCSASNDEEDVLILYVTSRMWTPEVWLLGITLNHWLPIHVITDYAAAMTTNQLQLR